MTFIQIRAKFPRKLLTDSLLTLDATLISKKKYGGDNNGEDTIFAASCFVLTYFTDGPSPRRPPEGPHRRSGTVGVEKTDLYISFSFSLSLPPASSSARANTATTSCLPRTSYKLPPGPRTICTRDLTYTIVTYVCCPLAISRAHAPARDGEGGAKRSEVSKVKLDLETALLHRHRGLFLPLRTQERVASLLPRTASPNGESSCIYVYTYTYIHTRAPCRVPSSLACSRANA